MSLARVPFVLLGTSARTLRDEGSEMRRARSGTRRIEAVSEEPSGGRLERTGPSRGECGRSGRKRGERPESPRV